MIAASNEASRHFLAMGKGQSNRQSLTALTTSLSTGKASRADLRGQGNVADVVTHNARISQLSALVSSGTEQRVALDLQEAVLAKISTAISDAQQERTGSAPPDAIGKQLLETVAATLNTKVSDNYVMTGSSHEAAFKDAQIILSEVHTLGEAGVGLDAAIDAVAASAIDEQTTARGPLVEVTKAALRLIFAPTDANGADVVTPLQSAETELIGARALIGDQAASIEQTLAEHSNEKAALQITLGKLVTRDPFETVVRLQELQNRMELHYGLVRRTTEMSLVKML